MDVGKGMEMEMEVWMRGDGVGVMGEDANMMFSI